MVPGFNGGEAKLWDKFDPKLTNYVVPSPIVSAIGGGYALSSAHVSRATEAD